MSGGIVHYSTAGTLLQRAAVDLLTDELPDELDAVAAALDVQLDHPQEVIAGYWAGLADALPQVVVHPIDRQTEQIDQIGADTLRATLRIYLTVGEGELHAGAQTEYSDALFAYAGAISALLQRRLPLLACETAGLWRLDERTIRWEPQVDTEAGTWIQRCRIDMTTYQTVDRRRPVAQQQ